MLQALLEDDKEQMEVGEDSFLDTVRLSAGQVSRVIPLSVRLTLSY